MTVRDHIAKVQTQIEDPSNQPQTAIAYPPKLVYYSLVHAFHDYIYKLKNSNNKTELVDLSYFITCVEMGRVDTNSCACNPNTGCVWQKSVNPLPKHVGKFIKTVRPTEDTEMDAYGFVAWEDIPGLKKTSRASRLNNKYTLRNEGGKEFLYLHSFEGSKPRYLSLDAGFYDLFEIYQYTSGNCGQAKKCNFLDTPWDIPMEHVQAIYTSAIEFIRRESPVGPSDDGTDDIDGSKKGNVRQ